jgi:hypothetical protein
MHSNTSRTLLRCGLKFESTFCNISGTCWLVQLTLSRHRFKFGGVILTRGLQRRAFEYLAPRIYAKTIGYKVKCVCSY